MGRRWLLSLLCLSVFAFCLVPLTRAGGDLRVNEADTRIFLARDPAEVLLAIENSTGKTMPDRVVVYLWLSGVVKFNFKFRPRFGMNAKTAASVVYDYYNPEARAVVEPATFRIK